MRFSCQHCGFPVCPTAGVNLAEVECPKCHHCLELPPAQRMIAGYELLEKIGSGGFGTVWKASDKESGKVCALKLISKDAVSEDEQIHLLRQIRSSKRLTHPRIVDSRDFGEAETYWYLVSDYVVGTPLGEWAKTHQPDASRSAMLCAELADAVHYIHSHGFVHRDLKPGNVIVDLDGRPNLIDFGLSKSDSDPDLMAIERYRMARNLIRSGKRSGAKSILGTLAYMSPEQAGGHGFHASFHSDIYSLGVILYELLCGRRPFGGSGQVLVRQILASRPRRPSRYRKNLSPDLDAICLKAIARRPEIRYATAADFAEDCRNAVAGHPIQARVSRWSRWW